MNEEVREELPQLLGELALYSCHAGTVGFAMKYWAGLDKLKPGHEATLLLAGLILVKEGEHSKAEKYYRQILETTPEHIAARTFLAECLIGQQRWREASDQLHELLRSESDDPALVFAEALQKDLQAGNFHRRASIAR